MIDFCRVSPDEEIIVTKMYFDRLKLFDRKDRRYVSKNKMFEKYCQILIQGS